ncbi:MAG: YceI family protein [Oligoflexia bacterium]|nr:YceI family protein [Oligoflexia bacterium]
MKTITTFIALTLAIAGSAYAKTNYETGTYSIDLAHSKIGFEIPHLVISSVEGRFDEYSGEVELAKKFTDSKVSVEIKTKSIDTAIAKRDDHLRSGDFFDAEKFPTILFKSKKFSGTPESFKLTGNLTIKGNTKEVVLDGKYLGTVKDGYGNEKAAFQASTTINRKDFGLTWSSMVEAGPVVGDEVSITLKIQAAKKK